MNCTYNYKGQWLTEEQLLNHPDFKGVSLPLAIERNHILSDTGENTDRQINFFSSATTETGVYENFIQFKRDQLFDLNNRLGKIHSAMKTKEVLADPAKLTRLKNLEREIKLYTEGSDILHIKGLRLEIKELEQSADRNAVGFYAENDLKRLAALAKSDDIDDLREADKLIKFYTLAGSFTWANKDDNPFFTAEEIFLKDENDVLTNEFRLSEDTMAAFKDWANRAIQHQI